MSNIGKVLVVFGFVIALLGGLMIVFSRYKLPFLGRLPGDIYVQKESFSFYFPVTTSILISLVLSLVFYIFLKR